MQAGRLEDEMIEIEVAETATGNDTMLAMGIDLNLNEMFGGVLPKKTKAPQSNGSRCKAHSFK